MIESTIAGLLPVGLIVVGNTTGNNGGRSGSPIPGGAHILDISGEKPQYGRNVLALKGLGAQWFPVFSRWHQRWIHQPNYGIHAGDVKMLP